jgi:hypothetical protein
LALHFNVLNDAEVKEVFTLQRKQPEEVDPESLSPRLRDLYVDRASRTVAANPFNHLISAIANHVAKIVNKDGKFGEAVKEILNHSAFIQVNTKSTTKGSKHIIQAMTATYPSSAVGHVELNTKNYGSTDRAGGVYTFKLKPSK